MYVPVCTLHVRLVERTWMHAYSYIYIYIYIYNKCDTYIHLCLLKCFLSPATGAHVTYPPLLRRRTNTSSRVSLHVRGSANKRLLFKLFAKIARVLNYIRRCLPGCVYTLSFWYISTYKCIHSGRVHLVSVGLIAIKTTLGLSCVGPVTVSRP